MIVPSWLPTGTVRGVATVTGFGATLIRFGFTLRKMIEASDVINFYDLLERLVDRTPWKDENDYVAARQLLKKVREVNLFGYLAENMTVKDPRSPLPEYGNRRLT